MTLIEKWSKSKEPRHRLWATLWCPKCDNEVGLGNKTHTITDDGMVSPSVICPHCDFHEFIQLKGWSNVR